MSSVDLTTIAESGSGADSESLLEPLVASFGRLNLAI